MRPVTPASLTALLAPQAPPCASLYQPTHRHHPDNQQDPIRFRNLLRDLERSLREGYPAREADDIVNKFAPLARDLDFWNHRTDALAILASPETFELFELQRPVRELLIVADSFHVKPLLRVLQSADRYQILCLNRVAARLYEGNRDALDPVDMPNVPGTIDAALGAQLTEPRQAVRSLTAARSAYHGAGHRKDEVDRDTERFFRVIDRAVLEQHSRPSGLPLLLAAQPQYHAVFHRVSHNPFLMAEGEGLQVDPDALSLDELRVAAWRRVEPRYLERLAGLIQRYEEARPRGLASDVPEEVAQAALGGRVDALLVDADRELPGRIDAATGAIVRGRLADPAMGDVLDDLAEAVLRTGGSVVVVPAGRMPVTSGVAAVYRF